MATDYISREAAADILRKAILDDTPFPRTMIDCLDDILDLPAADVVEVVRCRECKYWYDNAPTGYDTGACGLFMGITNASFFCADGKRRATDGDK